MKLLKYKFLLLLTVLLIGACSQEKLDETDTDPNNPTDVPLSLLLPPIQTHLAYSVIGGDMSLYAAVWSQLQTGVHAQLHSEGDRFTYANNLVNNTYNSIYVSVLNNLRILIEKAADEAAPRPDYQGIGLVLRAYTIGIATDAWGRVPYSDALQGSVVRQPVFDTQESIYTDPETGILATLDQAIALLGSATLNPANFDLIYDGNLDNWIKAAYSLKAHFMTRLKNTSYYDANVVIQSAENGFANASEGFIFRKFTATGTGEHPWQQEAADRTHFAVSESFYNLLTSKNDPRAELFFGDNVVPAPNGAADLDQAGNIYTKPYGYITSTSPLEFLTYDQLLFALAEAHLSNGSSGEAYDAYLAATEAAVLRVVGATQEDADTYVAGGSVAVGAGNLTLANIIEQKYISFYPFQSLEAYAEYRRTKIPNLQNPNGPIPGRFPYPQGELDNNGANVPNVALYPGPGVWWDDLTED